jgi:hypothetical protein
MNINIDDVYDMFNIFDSNINKYKFENSNSKNIKSIKNIKNNRNNRNFIIIMKKNISTVTDDEKIYTISKKRWSTYQSYNDYIVGFGSKYLLIDDINNPEECSLKFLKILNSGANMIQIEISKGLYGVDKKIEEDILTTSINPEILKSVGLIYIRSYLINFNPGIIQPFIELKKVSFKYENKDLIFNDYSDKISEFEKLEEEKGAIELRKYLLIGAAKSSERIKIATQCMREILIGNSTYINHSEYNEPDYHIKFWGEKNYEKLKQIKIKYDPNNKFTNIYKIDTKHSLKK